jgi:dihydrofolate reductase
MGRRTWDALDPRFRPLPGRRNLVLTRNPDWAAEGAEAIREIPAEGWVIGGAELLAASIDRADVLEVTELDLDVEGDTWAPPIGPEWEAETTTPWQTSRTGIPYRFVTYRRP